MNEIFDPDRYSQAMDSVRAWLDANVLHPHVLLQLALIALTYAAARALGYPLRLRLRSLISRLPPAIAGSSAIETALRQVPVLLFWAMLATEVAVMRAITWPSRSYLMGVAATLALVWVVVRVCTIAIRNRLLARLITGVVLVLAALSITGTLQSTLAMLDSYQFGVGDLQLTVLSLLEGTLLLVLLIWGSLAVSGVLERRLERAADVAPSARVLLGLTLRIGLVSLSVVIGLNSVGIDLTALAVLSGAVGIGIGFGLQKVISNLVSGVILLLDRSIKPGDVIQLDDTFGWITHLGARYVSLVTRDGKEYLVPNEDLITHKVVNWSYSDDLVRIETYIRASHDSDPHTVRRVAVEAALKVRRVQRHPSPVCHLREFGESSLEYLLRFWIRDPKNGVENVTGEVLLEVWDAFQEHGLKVPYPQHEVRVHPPVTITRDGAQA